MRWVVWKAVSTKPLPHCRERTTFGQPLIDNQSIHFRLAELRTEVECLRAPPTKRVNKYISGQDVTLLASMAKLKAGRLMREVTDSCLRHWGGQGFMWENPLPRLP